MPDMFENTILAANVWDKRKQRGFFGAVDDVLEQAGKKIPAAGGTYLRVGYGGIWIMRSNPFIDFIEDSDSLIVRGIIRIIVRSHLV
jgi:hypothetical protein